MSIMTLAPHNSVKSIYLWSPPLQLWKVGCKEVEYLVQGTGTSEQKGLFEWSGPGLGVWVKAGSGGTFPWTSEVHGFRDLVHGRPTLLLWAQDEAAHHGEWPGRGKLLRTWQLGNRGREGWDCR